MRSGHATCIEDIRAALLETLPIADQHVDGPAAAVAAVLREHRGRIELLFIRRAKRRGDPWSGHMAWPGGKREALDVSMLACATRETREELALDLDVHATVIGALPPLRFDAARHARLRAVFAYVFVLHGAPELRSSEEVAEAVWVPLSYFTAWASRLPWRWLGRLLPPVPPAFRYEGRLIWGLTQWLLAELLGRLVDPRAAAVRSTRFAAPAARDQNDKT